MIADPRVYTPAWLEVFRVEFWMRNYLSPTMKPTMVLGNNPAFGALDLGPVPRGRKKRAKTTTRRYKDKNGKMRYCGTSSLKQSQKLALVKEHFSFNTDRFIPEMSHRCEWFVGFSWLPGSKDLSIQVCRKSHSMCPGNGQQSSCLWSWGPLYGFKMFQTIFYIVLSFDYQKTYWYRSLLL